MDTSEITSAFLQGIGKWTGCYWPTQFGSAELNLQGLKSSQALLLARSTAGKERAEWAAANRWLEEIERDAGEAEKEASIASHLAIVGQMQEALQHAQRACGLESQYNNGSVWQPLCNAIEKQLTESGRSAAT